MPRAKPGEVWQVDLGMVAKTRPCLVLSRYPTEQELALLIIIPHTTSVRGNRWEFPTQQPFLEEGAFHLQQIQPVSLARLIRKLGEIPNAVFAQIRQRLARELDLG